MDVLSKEGGSVVTELTVLYVIVDYVVISYSYFLYDVIVPRYKLCMHVCFSQLSVVASRL